MAYACAAAGGNIKSVVGRGLIKSESEERISEGNNSLKIQSLAKGEILFIFISFYLLV
jgi:hypothetical protein